MRHIPALLRSHATTTIRRGLLPLLALAMLFTGCLSRPALTKQDFGFATPSATNGPGRNNRVLGIRRIEVAPPFDGQSLIYRTGEFSYERDPYAEFLVPPAQSLEEPIRAWFRADGVFRSVAEPGSALQPDILVEIFVDHLYGDFRNRTRGAAVLSARFIFFAAVNGSPGKALLQKEYSKDVPLRARTAAALVAGWNQELKDILAQVSGDLKAEPQAAGIMHPDEFRPETANR